MRVSELLYDSEKLLSPADARILLAHAASLSREFILAHPEYEVLTESAQNFLALQARRERGVPVAYLTRQKEFFGLDFYVDERVLIPRPETELLVEEVLARQSVLPPEATFVDVGTGSGCIAISLAKHLSQAKILATDISQAALAVARKNAKTLGVADRIDFFHGDLLSPLEALSDHVEPFAIAANLPYIGTEENNLVSREVRDHEPHTALFSGPTGLELYEKLFQQITQLARPPVILSAEIGFSQKKAVAKLIEKYFGNVSVVWKNDLAGLDRVLTVSFI